RAGLPGGGKPKDLIVKSELVHGKIISKSDDLMVAIPLHSVKSLGYPHSLYIQTPPQGST
ncbi:MAG: hypothetical protein VX281_08385, partial [Pseudomonadota bacterium]|nr:hypothetical protein [Pseudomonadota bacterium]